MLQNNIRIPPKEKKCQAFKTKKLGSQFQDFQKHGYLLDHKLHRNKLKFKTLVNQGFL